MNELKTAWRNMLRGGFYSAVNIFGLTIGLTACFVVTTVIIDELSYDKQWSKENRLYRILAVNKVGEGRYNQNFHTYTGLPPALKANFPEVEEYAIMNTNDFRLQLGKERNEGVPATALSSDTGVFKMLDFHTLAGNPGSYTPGYENIVLTKSFAERFFRVENVVGKIIFDKAVYEEKPTAYLITGIVADLPSNSHLRADVLVIGDRRQHVLDPKQAGGMTSQYLLMRKGIDMEEFARKVNKWYKSFVTVDNPLQHSFQPISEVYLDSPFAPTQHVRGDRRQIMIFSAVAALLLIIACINFINLSTARATARIGDTAIRKLLGAERGHIIQKVFMETLLFFGLATVLALGLYFLALSPVQLFIGHSLGRTVFSDPGIFSTVFGALLLAALISGTYPALLVSGFRPAGILKGSMMSNRNSGRSLIRRSLVVVQFSLCIVVLIAMIVVHQQLRFMEKADIGFDKENLVNIGFISWGGKGDSFKNELNRIPGVMISSRCSWTPSKGPGNMSTEIDDPLRPGNKTTIWHLSGDIDFAQTLRLRLREGRYLNSSFKEDMKAWSGNALVTATTARLLGIKKLNVPIKMIGVTPVGIIEDFHNDSYHEPLGPTVISNDSASTFGNMIVRVNAGATPEVMLAIRRLWMRFYPDKVLELDLVSDMLASQYKSETKLRQLFTFFGVLTMLLASLGIFGLIAHNVHERVREIAIRKVLGGSVASIAWLLSSRFAALVVIAIVIASPIGMWCMTQWLESFSFRIELNWTVPVIAGVVALAIALLTVMGQAIKAALANPVESLRRE